MKYVLTIQADSINELSDMIMSMELGSVSDVKEIAQSSLNLPEQPKEKKTRKAKDTTETTLVKDSEPVEKTAAPNAYDAVKTATLALIKAKGKPAALELLAEFEVKAATELKNSDYDAYVNRVNIVLGKAA